MEVTVGTAWQNSQTLLFLHEKKTKNNVKGRSSIAFVKEKNVLKKCTKGGYSRGDGGGSYACLSFFPIGRKSCYESDLSLLNLS